MPSVNLYQQSNELTQMKKDIFYTISVLLGFIICLTAYPQNRNDNPFSSLDSPNLNTVLSKVLKTYPTLQKARTAIEASEEKINLARSAYHPYVDVNASYSRIGPVPEINFPPYGEFKLFPENNYSASVNYHQNLYDFGKTASRVELEAQNRKLADLNYSLTQQALSMQTINLFYSLVYIQNALSIKEQQLINLRELVDFTKKKMETGSSTNFELLTTQVKLSATESQITDLHSTKTHELSVLSSLLDSLVSDSVNFSQKFISEPFNGEQQELINKALDQREELKSAMEDKNLSLIQYNIARSQNRPDLGIYALAGEKNGYVPEIEKIRFNYAAGLSFNIPVYDGAREKSRLALARTGMIMADDDLDLAKRKVVNEVVESYSNLKSAWSKINQFQLQEKMASEAYSLAKVNYQAGAITNLDLLNAETNLSDSRLMLLKSRIDYVLSLYILKMSIGEKLFEY